MTMAKRMHIQPFLYIGLAIASIALVPALSARKVTTKVDVKALKATRISEDETAMSGSRRTPLSGDSAKAAMMEREMVAEGYYGTKCIRQVNDRGPRVDMPILNAVYRILYEGMPAKMAIGAVKDSFS